MKKRIFGAVIFGALICRLLQGVYASPDSLKERGNDRSSIDAARRIAELDGVKEAAVLSLDECVLAGISVMENTDCEELCIQTEKILKASFPGAETYRTEAGDEWAEKVIELSFYLDTNISPRILKKRFMYLATENREI